MGSKTADKRENMYITISMKVRHSSDTVLLVARCGLTTMGQSVNFRVWNGNIQYCQSTKKSKTQAINRASNGHTSLGLASCNSRTPSREGHNNK
jgi:hypothetical protein